MTNPNPDIAKLRKESLALLNAGKAEQALPFVQQILKQLPEDVDALDHLATAYTMLGQFEEAERHFQQCLALGVAFPETLSNAARNANLLGNPAQQLAYAKRMLSGEKSQRVEGLQHCVDALRDLKRAKDAWAANQQLLMEDPNNAGAQKTLVRVLIECGEAEKARQCCLTFLEEQPENIALQMSLIEATILTGELTKGLAMAEALLEERPEVLDAMSALGFHYQFLADMPVSARLTRAKEFGAAIGRDKTPFTQWPITSDPERRLRIGLLSGDLRQHPVIYFLISVLEALQESSLAFVAYDTLVRHDDYTARIHPFVSHWRDVKGMTDSALAEQIRSDNIDILIDLSGYTTGGRLGVLAMKPAPIQASWLGYLGSTGLPSIDFILADPTSVPSGAEGEFTEKVWRLPHCPHCFTIPEEAIEVQPPPALRNGFITFGCMNKPDKINDRVLALWSQVLAGVPNSRLHLRGNQFSLPQYRERFRKRLSEQGIDTRIVSLNVAAPRRQYLEAYHQIDIALDPFPYNGGTTSAEALWMGVPLLTLSGDRMMARIGHSFLKTCGMEDWVATTPTEFVELAIGKAADLQSLTSLRHSQRTKLQSTPLFNAQIFSHDFELAMREMWRVYLAKAKN